MNGKTIDGTEEQKGDDWSKGERERGQKVKGQQFVAGYIEIPVAIHGTIILPIFFFQLRYGPENSFINFIRIVPRYLDFEYETKERRNEMYRWKMEEKSDTK